jgi:hypothetical protein
MVADQAHETGEGARSLLVLEAVLGNHGRPLGSLELGGKSRGPLVAALVVFARTKPWRGVNRAPEKTSMIQLLVAMMRHRAALRGAVQK